MIHTKFEVDISDSMDFIARIVDFVLFYGLFDPWVHPRRLKKCPRGRIMAPEARRECRKLILTHFVGILSNFGEFKKTKHFWPQGPPPPHRGTPGGVRVKNSKFSPKDVSSQF